LRLPDFFLISKKHSGASPFYIQTVTGSFKYIMEKQRFKGFTVLVAEDDDDNFEFVFQTCKRTGLNMLRASNGREAVELCATRRSATR